MTSTPDLKKYLNTICTSLSELSTASFAFDMIRGYRDRAGGGAEISPTGVRDRHLSQARVPVIGPLHTLIGRRIRLRLARIIILGNSRPQTQNSLRARWNHKLQNKKKIPPTLR